MKSATPIPHWVVNDGVAAIQFYEAAFGAVCNSKHLADDGKRIMHADLTCGSGDVPDADAAWVRVDCSGACAFVGEIG